MFTFESVDQIDARYRNENKKRVTRDRKQNTPMQNYKKKVLKSVAYLKAKIKKTPYVGMLTGTGLGESTQSLNISTSFDYESIPNFPVSTVESHHGRLLVGDIKGCTVMAMQGRFILTNAAGGLNTEFNAGDIMLITDHINLTGSNPLIGPNEDRWGIRFPEICGRIRSQRGLCRSQRTFVGNSGRDTVFKDHWCRSRWFLNGP
jgi:hypothetical protein